MTISMYQASVPVFVKGLTNLKAILEKAAAHAQAKKIDDTVFVNARLYPDMLPLSGQIQIATDMARGTMARLVGQRAAQMGRQRKDDGGIDRACRQDDRLPQGVYRRADRRHRRQGDHAHDPWQPHDIHRPRLSAAVFACPTSISIRRRPTACCVTTVSRSASWISWASSASNGCYLPTCSSALRIGALEICINPL